GDRNAVVVVPVGNQRPAIVLAGLDEVQFIAAARTVFNLPEPSIRRERQAIRSADAAGPRLGGREVGAGKGVGPHHRGRLGRLRIRRRIDYWHSGGASLACHRIAGSQFAVKRQSQDFAEWLIGVLGGCHALPFANAEEEILAVGRKGDRRAELAASPSLAITPDDLESFEARRTFVDLQLSPREREAGTAGLAWLGIGEINIVVGRIMRRKVHAQHSTLSLPQDCGDICNGGLLSLLSDQP